MHEIFKNLGSMNIGFFGQSFGDDHLPPFKIDGTRFDLKTYFGRLLHTASIIDPRLLLVTDEKLNEAQHILDDFRKQPTRTGHFSDSELWDAKRFIDSAINPATGEVVHPAARMCSFIPASLPITLGMLTMTSPLSIVTLQWINQSYNALFNYSHRSQAGSDKSQVLKAYGLATAVSCGLALALNKVANRIKPPWLISTFAVMAAGSANVAFTRSREITEGVDVMNRKGEVVGQSKIAGKYAVGYTVLSRSIFLPIPIMVLPGIMSQLIASRFFSGRVGRGPKLFIDVGCIILSQAIALPVCIAAFPQTLEIKRSQLESELRDTGPPDESLFVHKGV